MVRPRRGILLYNADIITLDSHNPEASWMLALDGRITELGSGGPPSNLYSRNIEAIDCGGGAIVPGFNDAHSHILSSASNLVSIDLAGDEIASISDICVKLRNKALLLSKDTWIRGAGYSDFDLRERRHPNRLDIDRWVPAHPVRLIHKSGHATVLNSRALGILGINRETVDPPEGFIERDNLTGEPTGVLLEMNDYLEGLMPRLSQNELILGIKAFNESCLRSGITSVQDATHLNSLERWNLFSGLKNNKILDPRLNFMVSASHVDNFLDEGLEFFKGDQDLRVGAVKLMVTMTTGQMWPTRDVIRDLLDNAYNKNFQVAIHAVDKEIVTEVAEILSSHWVRGFGARNRIEHCSECPDSVIQQVARGGVNVVTQPGFIYHSGERYLMEIPLEIQPWVYNIGSLMRYGVPVAFSSDSPVIPLNPMTGIYSAVTRLTKAGNEFQAEESISVKDSLTAYTLGGAYASFEESEKGSIKVGKLADVILLDSNPMIVDPLGLKNIEVSLTIIGGNVVWRK